MKFVDEYRDPALARSMIEQINNTVKSNWTIMEICGGQTHSIMRNGIDQVLPEKVSLIHGPGCPVCVTPIEMIDRAIAIALEPNVILCSFGDMLRIPGSSKDLFVAKSEGADVRIVYSTLDSIKIASEHLDKQVVFFGIGFETTAPSTAMAIHQANRLGLDNFFMLNSHVLVPPAMTALLDSPDNRVQAYLAAGHVCAVQGSSEYEPIAEKYSVPIIVTGFEPLDILSGILAAVTQLENGTATVENQYKRVVPTDGNPEAKALVYEIFEVTDRKWRGIGTIPSSGLQIRESYKQFDAEKHFNVEFITAEEPEQCISGLILRGLKKQNECPEFNKTCTPMKPLGATMVSSEGACAAYYTYNQHKVILPVLESK